MSVLVLGLLAACAPRLQASGPFTGTPAFNGDVMIAADGARLPLRVWRPDGQPRAAVAALHGFNDYANAYDAPARAWARRGIITYAIDQRGFGRAPHPGIWAGADAMVSDLLSLAETVRRRHPGLPLVIAGDSMGGAVVLTALAREPALRPDGVVLIAPAVWGRDHLGPFKSATLWLAAHTVPWFEATAEGLNVTPSDNRDMLRKLWQDPLVIKSTRIDAIWGIVNLMDDALAATRPPSHLPSHLPMLLMYGAHDEVIPAAPTLTAIANLKKSDARVQAAFYPDGYHMLLRDLGAEAPIDDAGDWILSPGIALPSGADKRPPAFGK